MLSGPPKKLLLPDVPRHIRTHYGQDVTRVTVYNWTKIGRENGSNQRVKLRTREGEGRNSSGGGPNTKRYTTTSWLEAFLKETTEWI